MAVSTKPTVYVTRHLPDEAWKRLWEFCRPASWDFEYSPPSAVLRENVTDKAGLLCLLTDTIDAELMDSAPLLRVISQCAVGYDNIDVPAATLRGIRVGNTPGVLTETTADLAFCLLMAAARRVVEGAEYVKAGRWQTWGLTLLLGQDVHGATLGIVGMGRIGAAVARRAGGFGMRILYHDRVRKPALEVQVGATFVSLDRLLSEADYVTLHVDLSASTQGLIGEAELDLMKPTAILINTSRGPVVQTAALVTALKSGKIGAAALDVTDPEPLPGDHELLGLPNALVVPHIASASSATRLRMAMMAVENLEAGLAGRPLPYSVNAPD